MSDVLCHGDSSMHDDERQPTRKKLGLLGGTSRFEDRTFAIYAVPDPLDVISPEHDQSYPVCGIYNSFTIQASHIHPFKFIHSSSQTSASNSVN